MDFFDAIVQLGVPGKAAAGFVVAAAVGGFLFRRLSAHFSRLDCTFVVSHFWADADCDSRFCFEVRSSERLEKVSVKSVGGLIRPLSSKPMHSKQTEPTVAPAIIDPWMSALDRELRRADPAGFTISPNSPRSIHLLTDSETMLKDLDGFTQKCVVTWPDGMPRYFAFEYTRSEPARHCELSAHDELSVGIWIRCSLGATFVCLNPKVLERRKDPS